MLFNFFSLKICEILNIPFFLFLLIEMPSLNRNERIACLECGRENTRLHASRHRKHCGVLKCSNRNFYRYSSEELSNHIKKNHCQHNVKLCAQQSQNTLIVENTLNKIFLLNLKRLYTKFEKLVVKNLQFYHHFSCFVIFRGSD